MAIRDTANKMRDWYEKHSDVLPLTTEFMIILGEMKQARLREMYVNDPYFRERCDRALKNATRVSEHPIDMEARVE